MEQQETKPAKRRSPQLWWNVLEFFTSLNAHFMYKKLISVWVLKLWTSQTGIWTLGITGVKIGTLNWHMLSVFQTNYDQYYGYSYHSSRYILQRSFARQGKATNPLMRYIRRVCNGFLSQEMFLYFLVTESSFSKCLYCMFMIMKIIIKLLLLEEYVSSSALNSFNFFNHSPV